MEREEGYLESETFTENELVAALVNAQDLFAEDAAGYMRTEEIADAVGWSIKKVRKELRKLMAAGLIERGKVPFVDLAGRSVPVVAYRLKAAGEDR